MATSQLYKRKEYLKKTTTTKEVYWYRDDEYFVDQISKEIYLKEDRIVHFPIPYEGKNKYTTITQFTYLNFNDKLPVGVYKAPVYGYGFTKILYPVISFLNDHFDFIEVVIEKDGEDLMDTAQSILYLSDRTLQTWNNTFTTMRNRYNAEKDRAARQHLNQAFPGEVIAPAHQYIAGTLTGALSEWGNSMDEFNGADRDAIKNLFDKLTIIPNFFTDQHLTRTKEIIDNKFIQKALTEFDVLYKAKDTPTLEKKWQAFLKQNSWIFSTLFAQPVILHSDEAYVGGKTLDNTNGKYNDFLIKNRLSNNVSFLEIKTHLSLLTDKAYRGNDVFSFSKDLTGAISQVLNQRDLFQKEFYTHAHKNKSIESFNSKAMVLIGSISSLTPEEKSAFELFRSNSKDVEILTFDELRMKIESLLKLMTGKIK